jgi:hypothetical protein
MRHGMKLFEQLKQGGVVPSPTKIAPCNYVFEGAGVKLKTTPLMKRRKDTTKVSYLQYIYIPIVQRLSEEWRVIHYIC